MMTGTLLLALCAPLAGAPQTEQATAQGDARSETWNKDEWAALSEVIGGDVRLRATAGQLREATEDVEEPDRDEGQVTDLLVDPKSGEIEWAVVSCGGLLGIGEHTVAVPASKLKWNTDKRIFDLDATEQQLESAPKFDLSEAKRKGLEATVGLAEASWSKGGEFREPPREASGSGEIRTFDTLRVRPAAERFFVASELDDYPVYARADEFGDVSETIVDLREMRLAYAIVSHGGIAGIGDEKFLVPFKALSLCDRVDEEGRVLCADRSEQEMTMGVKYEKPKEGVIDAESARRARQAD